MNLTSYFSILLMLLVALSSCAAPSVVESNQTTDPAPKTIKLGALLSLTGDAANFGQSELNAATLAVEDFNEAHPQGPKMVLVVEDIGTLNTNNALTAMRKLHDVDGIFAMVGPTWDMLGLSQSAEEEKVVMVSASNTEGIEFDHNLSYHFVTQFPIRAEIQKLVEYSSQHDWKKIVLIRDTDSFSGTISTLYKEGALASGVELTEIEMPIGEKDFRTPLIKIAKGHPDAIFAAFATEEPRGPFLKQLHEAGLNLTVFGTDSIQNGDLIRDYGSFAEGKVIYAYPKETVERMKFNEKYSVRFGADPTGPTASNAYDAAWILLSALHEGAKDADQVVTAISNRTFPSASFGNLTFDSQGYPSIESAPIVLKTVKNGTFVEVSRGD